MKILETKRRSLMKTMNETLMTARRTMMRRRKENGTRRTNPRISRQD